MSSSRGFAASTSVSVDSSRLAIEKLLRQAGATAIGTQVDYEKNAAIVAFVIRGGHYRVMMALPIYAGNATYAKAGAAVRAHEQAVRQRWRVVWLLIKAKLEAIRCGFSSLEKEFLADLVVTSDGRTVAEVMPALLQRGLPALPPTRDD